MKRLDTSTQHNQQAWVLSEIAAAVATANRDRAIRIADTITDPNQQAWTLSEIAADVARTDPSRAARIADTITEQDQQAQALSAIATWVAKTDVYHAACIADTITDPDQQAQVMSEIAAAIATTETDQENGAGSPAPSVPSHNSKAPPAAKYSLSHSKGLLAAAWSVGRWEIPVRALPAVDSTVLKALMEDLLIEP